MRPETLLKSEMKRLNYQYRDVRYKQSDIANSYYPTMPKTLDNNRYGMDENDFALFKSKHLKLKKKIELQVIKNNQQEELMRKIVALNDLDRRHKKMRDRSEFFKYTIGLMK